MNWDAIGAIGEVLGAVAVIVTLAYLAVQVRQNARNLDQNTRAIVSSAEIAGAEQVLMAMLPLAQSADLADILVRGGRDFDSLTAAESARFSAWWQSVLISHQGYFFQNQRGLLTHEVWESYSSQFNVGARQPGVQQWWSLAKRIFDPSFQDYFESKFTRSV